MSLPVRMSKPLYIWRESAERMLALGRSLAISKDSEVLPEAVGPQMTKMEDLLVILRDDWSITQIVLVGYLVQYFPALLFYFGRDVVKK